MDRPTLRQLETLDTIAREGSFRAAARALGVSQVAVSDHIRQLEARLNVSLFDRSRGGKARLSEAGDAALVRARLILADCDALVTGMRDFAPAATASPAEPVAEALPTVPEAPKPVESEQDRPIMIGAHPSILSRFQEKLAAFEDAFPNRPVSVDFNCFVADKVAVALSESTISLAYFYALGETRVFPSDYLWSERWALFVSRDNPLSEREFVGRNELSLHGLVTFSPRNRLRPLLDACLAEAGLSAMPYMFESDDYGQLVEQLRESTGVLPLFGAAAARIGSAPGIKRLPLVDPLPSIEVRRVVHPSLIDDDEVQALIAALQ